MAMRTRLKFCMALIVGMAQAVSVGVAPVASRALTNPAEAATSTAPIAF